MSRRDVPLTISGGAFDASPQVAMSAALIGLRASRTNEFRCGRYICSRKSFTVASVAVSLLAAAAVLCYFYLPALLKKPSPAPPKSPDSASIRILVLGDSGVGTPVQFQVAAQMQSYASNALAQGASFQAFLHLGDVVYYDGNPQFFYDRVTVPYLSPLRAEKFLVALGNHDAAWVDNGVALLAFANMSSRYFENVFSSSDGVSVQLIVLDSNSLAYALRLNDTLTAEQTSFLDSKLAQGSFTWRIVAFHHPIFSCSRHGSTLQVMDKWLPVITARGNVNLVLSGHDHK